MMQRGSVIIRIEQAVKSGWREPFRILTTALLSLLLPLSFLLLARLSTARYLALQASLSTTQQPAIFPLGWGNIITTLLYAIVSLITVSAFVHGLTSRGLSSLSSYSSAPEEPHSRVFRPRLYASWILLCTLQVCVGMGIEGSIKAGIDGSRLFIMNASLEGIMGLVSRVIFLVGLHETMNFWSKSVVKAVVDDTVVGFVVKKERWSEKVGMGLSLGGLWWWKLRDEVDSLVVVSHELLQPLDFVSWWLYYLTVTIGTIRLLKGGIWIGMILLFRRINDQNLTQHTSFSDIPIDDKV